MASIIEWGETFLFHVVSREFQLEQPKPSVICQHGVDRRICDAKVQTEYIAKNAAQVLSLIFSHIFTFSAVVVKLLFELVSNLVWESHNGSC